MARFAPRSVARREPLQSSLMRTHPVLLAGFLLSSCLSLEGRSLRATEPGAAPDGPLQTAPAFGTTRPDNAALGDAKGAPAGGEAAAVEDSDASEEELDDGLELLGGDEERESPPSALTMSLAEVEKKLEEDPASLGAMSVGYASGGMLVNGVRMPEGAHYQLIDPGGAWGTEETIAAIVRCLATVNQRFPDTPKMFIGHISGKNGGHLSPHKSHQSGRDVDLGYYYDRGESRWFSRATAKNLDVARTWAFVRALIGETDVELILIDTSIQKLLKDYARTLGEDPAWLDEVFQVGSKSRRPLIRYAPGHATHLHVRFYNPVAQELGRMAHGWLVKKGRIKAPLYFAQHTVKKGETLGSIANRYGTTVKAIQQANHLRGTLIQMRATYKIPKTGAVREPTEIRVPPRRRPPFDPPSPAAEKPAAPRE